MGENPMRLAMVGAGGLVFALGVWAVALALLVRSRSRFLRWRSAAFSRFCLWDSVSFSRGRLRDEPGAVDCSISGLCYTRRDLRDGGAGAQGDKVVTRK